jgi:hypothetical protein
MASISIDRSQLRPKPREPKPGEVWTRDDPTKWCAMLVVDVEPINVASKYVTVVYFNLGTSTLQRATMDTFMSSYAFASDELKLVLK